VNPIRICPHHVPHSALLLYGATVQKSRSFTGSTTVVV